MTARPPDPRPRTGASADLALGPAVREAAIQTYQHAIRLVPVNLVWGIGLLVVLSLAALVAPIVAVAVLPLLGLPLVGLARIAGHVARGEDAVLSDALDAIRDRGWAALGLAAAATFGGLVLGLNAWLGASSGTPAGWALATLAGWGLVAGWLIAFPVWALLGDPARTGRPAREIVRTAVGVVVARPRRLIGLALVITIVLAAAVVLVAAILVIGLAFAVVLAALVSLPAADRLVTPAAEGPIIEA